MWEESGLLLELESIIGAYGGPDLIVDYENGDKTSHVMTNRSRGVVRRFIFPSVSEVIFSWPAAVVRFHLS